MLFVIVSVLCVTVFNPATARPTIEQFAADAIIDGVRISPNGRRLVYIDRRSGVDRLIVRDVSGDIHPPQIIDLTRAFRSSASVLSIVWANDTRLVFSALVSQSRSTRSAKFIQLAAINADGTRFLRLLDRTRGSARLNQVQRIISLLRDDPQHVLIETNFRRVDGGLNAYRLNIETGRVVRVATGDRHTTGFLADSHGRPRLRAGLYRFERRVDIRDENSGKWRNLLSQHRFASDAILPFGFADDDGLYVGVRMNGGPLGFYRYELKTGQLGAALFQHDQVDMANIHWGPEGKKAVAIVAIDDVPQYTPLTPDMAELLAIVARHLPDTNNLLIDQSGDGAKIILFASGPQEPGKYFVFDRSSDKMRSLGRRFPSLHPSDLHSVETFSYSTRDGLALRAYITRPKSGGLFPLVVMPHGGPSARDYIRYDYWAQFIASRGYVVFQPNFRGSTGYGSAFEVMGHGQWGFAMQDDIEDGVNALIRTGLIDRDRMCILGASYGGYAAQMAIIKTPNVYKCAVSFAGVSDLPSFVREGRRLKYGYLLETTLGDLRTDFSALAKNSPARRADEMSAPLLLIHGSNDRTVSPRHSRLVAKRLQRLSRPYRLVLIPDIGHQLLLPAERALVLREMEAFLNHHIGDGAGRELH